MTIENAEIILLYILNIYIYYCKLCSSFMLNCMLVCRPNTHFAPIKLVIKMSSLC